jgi:hypothetical protein
MSGGTACPKSALASIDARYALAEVGDGLKWQKFKVCSVKVTARYLMPAVKHSLGNKCLCAFCDLDVHDFAYESLT